MRFIKIRFFLRLGVTAAIGLAALFVLLQIFSFSTVELPSEKNPLIIYSPQARNDLKEVFIAAIREAKEDLLLSIFSLKDPDIIRELDNKARQGVSVAIFADRTNTAKKLSTRLYTSKASKAVVPGLMHQKVLITDNNRVWIGSTNLTTSSLHMHQNLVVGIYDPAMAKELKRGIEERDKKLRTTMFNIGDQQVEVYLLPQHKEALGKVCDLIEQSKKSVHVAMFTWTHPKLTHAVIEQHNRGREVSCVIDRNAYYGSSKGAVSSLKHAGVPVTHSIGMGLMHHKLLVIDGNTLATGSANWTRSAFSQNSEALLIVHNLNDQQKRKVALIWRAIEACSQP
ncbi:hypothetical protein JYU14_04205 [Simkania negevensis]|uniref:phospholipase D n=1 Tax=Simkania negevensis TaxID=83561 RepID=A0ABS3AWB6_9BACT|nr:hypothetical protein [Simkania negevensis]